IRIFFYHTMSQTLIYALESYSRSPSILYLTPSRLLFYTTMLFTIPRPIHIHSYPFHIYSYSDTLVLSNSTPSTLFFLQAIRLFTIVFFSSHYHTYTQPPPALLVLIISHS